MNETELKELKKLADEAKASIDEKDAQIEKLKANTTLLEEQLASLTAEHQETLERLKEAAEAQGALSKLVATVEPRHESLKNANAALKKQNAILTRLVEAANLRARGIKNPL